MTAQASSPSLQRLRWLAWLVLGSSAAWAGKQTDVSASKISLPSGPGSIEGLGESFEPQLNTGTFSFRIPFKLTALRGAVQPEISLSYNSGNGNGPVGVGWTLKAPSVQRQTDKGLPSYTAADTFIESGGEELVRLADGTLREENEASFTRWENLGAGGWRATLKNGTVLRFGQTAQARQDHPTLGTFKWLLENAQDTNGNRVEYRYLADRGQLYLSEIDYGLHATQPGSILRVTLGYEDGRPDAVVDYRGRFRCETRKRLAAITLWHGARRLRHWKLGYHASYPLSLLSSFTVYGDERANVGPGAVVNQDHLPPLFLDYARQALGTGWEMQTEEPALNVSLASGEADLVDLNGDALPDLLLAESGNYLSALNRGQGLPFGALQPFTTPAYLPALNEPGVRIADWRGDGRAKVLIPDGADLYYRDLNSPTTVGADIDYPVPGAFPLTDPTVQLIDVNNDRAMDLLAPGFNRFAFVLSSPTAGAPQFQEGPQTPLAGAVDFTQDWQFADMNGDRIPDLVSIGTVQDGGTVYHPHQGLTEFDTVVTMTGGPRDDDLGGRGKAGLTLVDIDHDGLSDLVMVDSGVVKVWPNRAGLAWGGAVVITGAAIPDWNEGATAARFADMNGNGSVDIVWNDPGAGYFLKYLELHPRTKPNQLTTMANGMGKTLEIEYKSSVDDLLAAEAAGTPWTSKPPFPMQVVEAFTERDGMGGTYRTEVTYRNGYYDAMEREFRGFESALRRDVGNAAQGAPTLLTEFLFHTGHEVEALKGRPRQMERREAGGAVFDRVVSTWQTRPLPMTPAAGETRTLTFCFQQDETTNVIEKGNGAPVQLFREMEWDNHGNQTRLADYGRVEGANRSAWDDERVTTRTFSSAFPSGLQQWILTLPVDETVADEHGVAKARTENFYDDETFAGANRGVVTKGNLTLQRKAVDVVAGTWIKAARHRHDAFGNVSHFHDPLSSPADASLGHFRVFSHDPEFHTYVEEENIMLGSNSTVPQLTASATYDKGLGVMSTSTDFNGHVTSYGFDTFARISHVVKPGDTLAAPTEVYDYKLAMPLAGGRTVNWISTSRRETAGGGTLDARSFFDGMGRKLMTRAEGEVAGQIVVSDTVVFNDRGTEWKNYLPYFDTGGLDWKDPAFASGFVEKQHDAAGRVLLAHQPEVEGYRAFSRTTYAPLTRLVEDEEQTRAGSPHAGCAMRHTEDGLRNDKGAGRLRLVEEIVKISDTGQAIASPTAWPTQYAYDILDNLTEIRDSKNNRKPMRYDGLSRLTFMDDPDRGTLDYSYDDASNLKQTLDARAQVIAMTYDGANRIQTEDYLDTQGRTPDVRYFYDAPVANLDFGDGTNTTGANTLGRLSHVQDLSGEEHFSYDARGRSVHQVKRIPDADTGLLVAYATRHAYDSMDRVTRLTYPDADFVTHGYNPRGLMESISGGPAGQIISSISYKASGQIENIAHGNGVATTYGYDLRLRLQTLNTAHAASGANLIDFSYTFDAASNITRIDDNRAAIAAQDLRRNTQVFGYDSLYRLSSATYPTLLGGAPGSMSYRYDRIGNMLEQSSNIVHEENGLPVAHLGTMAYGGTAGAASRNGRDGGQPGPHALTGITNAGAAVPGRVFPYDANGNMTNIDGLVCTWDFKDRLIAVENSSMRADYTYDYTNRRITKKVTPKSSGILRAERAATTHYINPYFEVRSPDLPVKYIWNGETRVARVTTNLETTQRVQRLRLHAGWNICALAVSVTNAGAQLSQGLVQQALWHDPATHSYHVIATGETLPAGTLLRLQASTAGTLSVQGTYAAAAGPGSYAAGQNWIPNARFSLLKLGDQIPAQASLWLHQASTQSWRTRLAAPAPFPLSQPFPDHLGPGAAVFATSAAAFTLDASATALEVRHYHQDHLGSSSVMTDADGLLVSESAFYAFGHPRHEHEPRDVAEAYGFTQKERDEESGLDYFEARFFASSLSRFISVDPFVRTNLLERALSPQKFNLMAYCHNAPLTLCDPTGCDAIKPQSAQTGSGGVRPTQAPPTPSPEQMTLNTEGGITLAGNNCRVELQKGTVHILNPRGERLADAQEGSLIRQGQTIETTKNSRIKLDCLGPDGRTTIILSADTTMLVEGRNPSPAPALKLEKGTPRTDVKCKYSAEPDANCPKPPDLQFAPAKAGGVSG